ncbi:MAG TPA: TetR/AcrR family transcriptional regulator [Nitrospirota bacterium]|nr:TetR/AcrR family transcriptional regulator [Nitrospirota bacterium]
MKQGAGRQTGDARRDQIVRAALKIIAGRGISGLTTAVLAREAGISEANLYRHFRNKDEIYMATVGQVREMITRNLDQVLAGSSDPVVVLQRFFTLQVELMEKNNGIPRLMFSEELHVHKNMREKILKTMYSVSETLASLVREGQKTGTIRKDIDALTTVLMFVAMLQGLAFRWSLGGFSFSLTKEAARAWKNFEKLIIIERPASGRVV